ncbi:Gfo/Idh/MocA family protein [Sutcliffiella sp. NC1]|uniref:Gfo/Idh/MocA family protein n=1 Tax=Sutcliffiella sp. NC1 TaxID=3004096 RepID=UPI0022DCF688|nr:Gfo/Idh/MocA family oxidoreductase [Sutcliffiella sp. NC1]WBL14589.1 Gfo/Idh/MocA family oxidoreductase [Sutcliffiella sp. NC1]
MSKLKIGVVGASWFADLWYLPVLQMHPDVTLSAICSRTGESAKRLAEKYNIENVYIDYKEMFEKENLDGVCIVTPNDSHKDITLAAIEKGLHVICEKPMALNAVEAEEMEKAARASSVVHAINFTYREHPGIQKLLELIKDGLIGNIHEAFFEYTGDYGLNGPPGWRGTISTGGIGGVLQDLGSHLIDVAQYILQDEIINVHGSLSFMEDDRLVNVSKKQSKDQAADSVSFTAHFSNLVRASFYTSWVAPQGNKHQTIDIKLYGSKGSIHLLTCELGTSLRYAMKGEEWREISLEGATPLQWDEKPSEEKFRPWRITNRNEVWKWVDHILGRKDRELATFTSGLSVQRVIDEVIVSAEKKINE